MTRSVGLQTLASVLAGTSVVFGATPVAAESSSYLNLEAGVGYATNPFLSFDDDAGSAFARVSAYGVHSIHSERTSAVLSAYVENTSYSNHYGSKQIFDLNAHVERQASARLRLFADAGFSGDIAGQLSGRFISTPTRPTVPDPTLPPPVTAADPDLFGLSGRQYRVSGQVGAAWAASERSSVNVSAGAQHIFFAGDRGDSDYSLYSLSAGYDRKLSEKTAVGFQLQGQQADYQQSDGDSTTITPQATVRTSLSEAMTLQASIGPTFSHRQTSDGNGWSTGLSLSGSLCRDTQSERLCARVDRYSQAAANSRLLTTTSAGVDYFKRLDANQTIQASASIVRYAGDGDDDLLPSTKSTYLMANAAYSRRVNDRLEAGANLGIRKLRQEDFGAPVDVAGSIFLRYRLGDAHD